MNIYIIFLGIIFTILSVAIISYISIATMVGPWIAPTLVLLASLLLRLKKNYKKESLQQQLGIIQTVGSVGGAVGMALGFTLPTLYFLDSAQFYKLLNSPLYFSALLGIVCLSSGAFGIWLAKILKNKISSNEKLPFPVSNLIYNTISSQTQHNEAKAMSLGLSITGIFCLFRDGIFKFSGLFPRVFYLFPSALGKELAIPLFLGPSYLAIGFTSGALIMLPLLLGIFSRYLVIYPINNHSYWLPIKLFAPLSNSEFTLAFCSGLVFAELFWGFRHYPYIIFNKFKNFIIPRFRTAQLSKNQPGTINLSTFLDFVNVAKSFFDFEMFFILSLSFLTLSYLRFPLLAQIFIIFGLIVSTYQICIISAKTGLVPFGRFATFIMVPTMLLFKIDYFQITFLCVFVSVCVCVASDLLFDYKVGDLCNIKESTIYKYQWLGLLVSALCAGAILWLFFSSFDLGSPELCAQRGQARALLIQMTNFNYIVLFCGFLYGMLIMRLKISSALMMGGILMPNNITIGLILGGLLSKFFKNPQKATPFWSGVFAFECAWILISVLLKLFI